MSSRNARKGHRQYLRHHKRNPTQLRTHASTRLRSGCVAARNHVNIPVRQHLGYYKSIAAYEGAPSDGGTPRDSDRILGCRQYNRCCLQNRLILERWRKIVNAIEKDSWSSTDKQTESSIFSRLTNSIIWLVDVSAKQGRKLGPWV
jgi:hypothetical protein